MKYVLILLYLHGGVAFHTYNSFDTCMEASLQIITECKNNANASCIAKCTKE